MTRSNTVNGNCPGCGGTRRSEQVAAVQRNVRGDDVATYEQFSLLRCLGCGSPFAGWRRSYRIQGEKTEWLDAEYWPKKPVREEPDWLADVDATDAQLAYLFHEVYAALDAGLHVLAAIGVRTTLDRASEVLGIDPSLTFEKKLQALCIHSYITEGDAQNLKVVADAGGAAVHRGWRPSEDVLLLLITTIEDFIHRTIVLGGKMTALAEDVPPRPPRRKAPHLRAVE